MQSRGGVLHHLHLMQSLVLSASSAALERVDLLQQLLVGQHHPATSKAWFTHVELGRGSTDDAVNLLSVLVGDEGGHGSDTDFLSYLLER